MIQETILVICTVSRKGETDTVVKVEKENDKVKKI